MSRTLIRNNVMRYDWRMKIRRWQSGTTAKQKTNNSESELCWISRYPYNLGWNLSFIPSYRQYSHRFCRYIQVQNKFSQVSSQSIYSSADTQLLMWELSCSTTDASCSVWKWMQRLPAPAAVEASGRCHYRLLSWEDHPNRRLMLL